MDSAAQIICHTRLPSSLLAFCCLCPLAWALSTRKADAQNIDLQATAPTVTNNTIAMPPYGQRQIILQDYQIIPAAGTPFKLTPPADPVEFSDVQFDADKLARRALTHLRKAARDGTNTAAVQAAGAYAHRLLLRPFQLIGTANYSETRAIRQQFRRQLADRLREQHQQSTSSDW